MHLPIQGPQPTLSISTLKGMSFKCRRTERIVARALPTLYNGGKQLATLARLKRWTGGVKRYPDELIDPFGPNDSSSSDDAEEVQDDFDLPSLCDSADGCMGEGALEGLSEVECEDVDFTKDEETRNQYSCTEEEAEDAQDHWSYAETMSGDEGFKPAETDDEAEEANEEEQDHIEDPGDQQQKEAEAATEEAEPVEEESDDEDHPAQFQSRRRAAGQSSEFLTAECINVTCFEKQMEALIESKADLVFSRNIR